MNPAAEYLQPFLRRQRIVLRIDAVLHALFLVPIVTLLQSRFSWSDTDTVTFVAIRVAICGGTVALGFFVNRALLRSWRTSAIFPIVSSAVWIVALPVLSAFYLQLVHAREMAVLSAHYAQLVGAREIDGRDMWRPAFSEGFSISVGVWFVLLALMSFYKLFYLFTVQQYRKWSRLNEAER